MEAGDENSGNPSLKRQRAPLSDSEDNVFSPSEIIDGQKRRRLEAAGPENRSPKPSNIAELEIKPDTPMVPSVRSRVQELNQRREAGAPLAQRCLSDPGTDSPSANKGFREHLLGEGEFSQRMERFKLPVFQTLPTPSPGAQCPVTCSNFVSDIQQKLQGATTPSSKQASRIRQEREQELSQLHFQPISENAWLKRSSSDPSLAQQERTPPSFSSPSSWIPRSRGRVHWPPMQSWDVHGKAEMKDGSFTESPMSGAERTPIDPTGVRGHPYSKASGEPVKLDLSSDGQQMEWKEQNTKATKEVQEEGNYKALVENNEKLRSQEETVFKLSFIEDQNVSSNGQRLLELTLTDNLTKEETNEVPEVTGSSKREVFSFEESEKMDNSSYNTEEIEPSTDEESKLWRYPQYKACSEDESLMSEELQDDLCAKEEGELKSSVVEEEKGGSVADHCDPFHTQDCECYLGDVSAEIASFSELQKDEKPRPEEDSVKVHFTLDTYQVNEESNEECIKRAAIRGTGIFTTQDQKDPEGWTHEEDERLQSKDTQTIKEHMDQKSNSTGPTSKFKQVTSSPFADVAQQATQVVYLELQRNTDIAKAEAYGEPADITGNDPSVGLKEAKVSESGLIEKTVQEVIDKRQGIINELSSEAQKAEGGESLKKVMFILKPELISDQSEASTSVESRAETSMSDAELSSHDETNTTETIDQMFEEVLEYAGRMEEERGNDDDDEDTDSGIGACSGDKDKMDTQSKKEKSKDGETTEVYDDSKKLESNNDELLTFPPSGILSPLSKSVEAVVTPLRLAANQESNLPSLLRTPGETPTPPVESGPLYSVDAYRTQRQGKLPAVQSVTPGVQRQAPQKPQPQCSVNIKERIAALNEEAVRLQTVINQTLQALSCCTDEEHGRGSLEEAEAEKLLLVSCEKHSALLAEVSRLREERNSESEEAAGKDLEQVSQQPCRGTVNITNIQLPLKVEFVCSSHSRAGRPSHYFFILIRYGPCNVIATPLATAADVQNGDTISFSTSVTLKDIRSSFEIDVEVYSLSHTSGSNCSVDRTTTKSRVTPRKLLNTITRSSNPLAPAALPGLNTRRSSNFCLVGSHKITLASLGHSKFPLDKMKLEGKIRKLLGDEFQEKVPFLSPLEGSIYLQLDSHSHSNVQHKGFLTVFELISGYGVWHRRYFVLEGWSMFYWNHPNDRETKEAEGSISLSNSMSQCVRPVKRDLCARPFTFELVSNIPHQQQDGSQEAFAKCWFSADTKQERLEWTEKLNQALLDFRTWNRTSTAQTGSRQSNISSGNFRESIL